MPELLGQLEQALGTTNRLDSWNLARVLKRRLTALTAEAS